jgi:hypothetical protein
MKSQEPKPNRIEKIIDRAIQEDLTSRPDFDMSRKIMSNVLRISNAGIPQISPTRKIDFAYLTFYVSTIAASVLIGYFLGNMYDISTNVDIISVSFENIGIGSFSII